MKNKKLVFSIVFCMLFIMLSATNVSSASPGIRIINEIADIESANVGEEILIQLDTVFRIVGRGTLTYSSTIGIIEEEVWKFTPEVPMHEVVRITAIDSNGIEATVEFELTVLSSTSSLIERDTLQVGGPRVFLDSVTNTFTGSIAFYFKESYEPGLFETDGNYIGVKVTAPSGVAVDPNVAILQYTDRNGDSVVKVGPEFLEGSNWFSFYSQVDQPNQSIKFYVDWDGIGGIEPVDLITIRIDENVTLENKEQATIQDTGVVVDRMAKWNLLDASMNLIPVTESTAKNLWVIGPNDASKQIVSLAGDIDPSIDFYTFQETGLYKYFLQTSKDKVYYASQYWEGVVGSPYAIVGFTSDVYEYYAIDSGSIVLDETKFMFEDQWGRDYEGSMPFGYKIQFTGSGEISSDKETLTLDLNNTKTYIFEVELYDDSDILLDIASFTIRVLDADEIDRFEVTQIGTLYASLVPDPDKYGKVVEVYGYEGNDPVKLPNDVIKNIQAITHSEYLKTDVPSKMVYATSNNGDLSNDISCQLIVEYNVNGQVNVEQQTVIVSPAEPYAVDVDVKAKPDANFSGSTLYVEVDELMSSGRLLALEKPFEEYANLDAFFPVFFEVTDQYGIVSSEVVEHMYVENNTEYSIDNTDYSLQVAGSVSLGDEFTLVAVTALGSSEFNVVVQ